MIYITGDIHGEMDIKKLSNKNWEVGKDLSKNDYVIILGDFGLPFFTTDTTNERLDSQELRSARKSYLYWIKWLSERPYTILWIDGNHDNHPYWNEQPTTEWSGGKVNIHPLAENVIHLKRGEYYNIDGKTFWVMGGAASHDKEYRTPGFSWWETEIPSFSEMNYGIDNLQMHNNKVDYILTHTMPRDLMTQILHVVYKDVDPTGSYLNEIYRNTEFKYWFCGHFHIDLNNKMYKMQVLYDSIVDVNNYQ